jgi:multidrug efflux system membrane fusion protein
MGLKTFVRNNLLLTAFLGILLLMALYFLWLNRIPYTTNAFVVANVRPVAALVPGPISEIYVLNNQFVHKGDPILTIYPRPYELAVSGLRHRLEAVTCEIRAGREAIEKDRHLIDEKKAEYAYAKYKSEIEQPLVEKDFVPKLTGKLLQQNEAIQAAELQKARAQRAESVEQLNTSRARKKSLEAQLEEAEIRLGWTTIYARCDGIVSNMFLSEGMVVQEGQELFAFVDTARWWVQANYKETVLTHVKPGQRARIKLPMYPGVPFHGRVTEIGWNANRQRTGQYALPVVEKENEWFLLPQRFPVQIALDSPPPEHPLHVGMSADVQIDIGRWQLPSLR